MDHKDEHNQAGAEYKLVRGLTRGLTILNALNRCNGGARIMELSELTGLHRTTIRRLLETLQVEGYVRRSESDDSYLLTLKVRELSEGFRDEQWISQHAAPLLGQLLQEVVWPTDISTLDVDSMVIRETTHRFSRLSFHRSMVGRRLPLLLTAAGRAYFANCPDAERESLITLIANSDTAQSKFARDPEFIENLIRRTRQAGYGSNFREWGEEKRIAAIALPIHGENRVLGCLNLVYIADAMTLDEAARRYLPAMQKVVSTIERRAAHDS